MRPSHLAHATIPSLCHNRGWIRAEAKTPVLCPYDAIQYLEFPVQMVTSLRVLFPLHFHFFNGFPFFRSPYSKPASISPDILSTLLFLDASPRGAVVGSRGHGAGFNHFPVRESYRRFKSASVSPAGARSSDIPVTETENRV